MKKFILLILVCLAFVGCKDHKQVFETEPVSLNVERVISTDKEFMFANYGGDYRWFETCVLMEDYLDEDTDGTIASISNVFQVVNMSEDEKSADVFVVLTEHTPDTSIVEVKEGFWIEDQVLNDEAINITFKEAFDKLMATNCPKPHSKYCVLRKEVGPVDANPQYIFGNLHEVVFVDAVTGEVSEENPTFPEGFKMPLGEWP